MNINHVLATRSHFSIGESMLSPKKIVEKAKELNLQSVGIVDTMTVSNMVEFSKAAKKEQIKPIIGCRLRVVDDPTYRKPKKNSAEKEKPNHAWYPKVYVLNKLGMKDLMRLLTLANSEAYFYYHARIGFDDLIDALEWGNLAISTGDFYSVFHRADYTDKLDAMRRACSDAQTFVEIVPINTPLFDKLNVRALKAANDLSLPVVMTMPVMYEQESDANTLDVLTAITSNTKMSAPWRSVPFIRDFNFKQPGQYVAALVAMKKRLEKFYPGARVALLKNAVENMGELSDMCEYQWEKQEVSLPKMAEDEMATLIVEVKKGWRSRLEHSTMGYKPTKEQLQTYRERLRYELGILKDMGFERYFLVVQDLVNWSKSSGIMVGPGRGSVGGSLIAYLLGVTDVDPLRFNLIFERFINPDRLDLPDADLDFMSSRRHEVIDYLVEKYGKEKVAGISNYSTLASASALRDAGRVHELSMSELQCTKYVPKEHGKSLSLDAAAEQVPELSAFKDSHFDLWNHATKLEGTMRSLGQHAAGIVVAGEPVVNRAVIEQRAKTLVVNWDKRVVEEWGLVKMDILGLSTLDIITKALNMIYERHKKRITMTDLPLDDKKVLEAFGKGDTVGVFQFESAGMRKLLRDLAESEPLTFDEISAATALYRPGPMDAGLMDDYVAIKQGYKIPYYEHTALESSLKETYSVMVYQEQIMRIVQDLCGFTMTEADHIRKAIGKKDKEKMASMKEQFVKGATAGFVQVKLDDGRVVRVHKLQKINTKESGSFTIEEIAKRGLTPIL